MENGKLWEITADSSSDLFCRSWVMSTLKPPAGRKWGSPLGSYHSSFLPANRRDCDGLPHLSTMEIKDTQCVAWLLVEVGQFLQQTLTWSLATEGPAKVRKYKVTPESFPHTWYLKLSPPLWILDVWSSTSGCWFHCKGYYQNFLFYESHYVEQGETLIEI